MSAEIRAAVFARLPASRIFCSPSIRRRIRWRSAMVSPASRPRRSESEMSEGEVNISDPRIWAPGKGFFRFGPVPPHGPPSHLPGRAGAGSGLELRHGVGLARGRGDRVQRGAGGGQHPGGHRSLDERRVDQDRPVPRLVLQHQPGGEHRTADVGDHHHPGAPVGAGHRLGDQVRGGAEVAVGAAARGDHRSGPGPELLQQLRDALGEFGAVRDENDTDGGVHGGLRWPTECTGVSGAPRRLARGGRAACDATRTTADSRTTRETSVKKFLNTPDGYLSDALAGFAAAHPELRVDIETSVVSRARGPVAGKVGLVSGGGSGHEPLHAGFVGDGMLDAACPGEVFTSPTPDRFLGGLQAADGGEGVVLVVKNYTGDVMNAQMAAEMAEDGGLRVRQVLVDDDVAVEDSTFTAGRRGTGATVLVEKIAGAAAARGDGLDAVAEIGRRVNAASRSFAIALTSGTVPSAGRPGFDLPEDEIEVGVGIHGEPGRRREKLRPAQELVGEMLGAILGDRPMAAGSEAIVL